MRLIAVAPKVTIERRISVRGRYERALRALSHFVTRPWATRVGNAVRTTRRMWANAQLPDELRPDPSYPRHFEQASELVLPQLRGI